MTSGTVPQDVKRYLEAVRARLADLPADERDDLLADVEPSILDSTAEGDLPVELRLGPPQAFADELRAAAGLPPRKEAAERRARPSLRQRVGAADVFVRTSPDARWLRELAPLWWALRGLVLVGLATALYDRWVNPGAGLFSNTGDVLLVLALSTAATIASIAIGLRRPRRGRLLVAVNLVLALAVVPVTWHVLSSGHAAVVNDAVFAAPQAADTFAPGFEYEGQPVGNVYAFDRDGRLLQDVRLFDQLGRPLEIGAGIEDPNRRAVKTRGGRTVFNAFPIRYFEAGTKRVANPRAGAPARPAPLATEPLR
jgi:hypothetical protein